MEKLIRSPEKCPRKWPCPLGGLCVQACEGPVEVLVNGFISFTPAGNSFAGDTKKICQRDGKYEGEYPPVDSWL
jgi:hypothetical protein